MSNEIELEDVVINLKTGKYSKEDIFRVLAWGEKHTDIFWPLMKKHQPEYYHELPFQNPILIFTLIQDIKDGFPPKISQSDLEQLYLKS